MKQDGGIYTCPYCRWHHSHDWTDVREEEELLKSEYLGSDYNKEYYLEHKMKFNVKICGNCNKLLKIRSYIITTLLFCFLGFFAIGMACSLLESICSSETLENIGFYGIIIGFIAGFILFLFYILWFVFGPSRAHVKFDRAQKYNALKPYNY